MKYLRLGVVCLLLALVTVVARDSEVHAFPGAGGPVVFSVTGIDPGHDITPVLAGAFSCTSADILAAPAGAGALAGCAGRTPPAPAGPVPGTMTFAPVTMGLNTGGLFMDDLNSLSYGEALGIVAVGDFDFSVDQVPADGGVTTAAGMSCGFVPDATTEAAGTQAQGDIFTTTGMPVGCNTQAVDELMLGLIAPSAPGVAPLDNVDALAERTAPAGPCFYGTPGAPVPAQCAAFTVTPGSAVLPAIPANACGGPPAANAATILVPPGTPPIPPCLPGGCPGGAGALPCRAVNSPALGLAPGDVLDALCWFDGDGNSLPNQPQYMTPGVPGDYYLYSVAPGSPSWGGPADLLAPSAAGPVPLVLAPTLGLLPTDNVDGLICHDLDTDFDLSPNLFDNCDTMMNAGQMNVDGDAFGDACDTEGPPGNANGVGGGDDCLDGVDNDGDGMADAADPACAPADTDGDGVPDATDNCPTVPNATQTDGDGDGVGTACDNCPTVANAGQENADGDAFGDACDACPTTATVWNTPAGDADCDGFTTAAEGTITTDPMDACGFTPGAPGQSDTWPPDLVESNNINILDVLALRPIFGTLVPPTSVRYDIVPSGAINISDVLALRPFFGTSCVP